MDQRETPKKRKRNREMLLLLIVAGLVILLAIFMFYGAANSKSAKEAAYGIKRITYTVSAIVQDSLSGEKSSSLLILVNKTHAVGESYVPEQLIQLQSVATDRDEKYQSMVPEAAEAFENLCDGAADSGYEIVCTTAYRPYEYQKKLYDSYVSGKGQGYANMYSARPGESEHQTGLAVDVSSPSVDYRLESRFGDTEEGKWLAEHCAGYGFILRYPEGKEEITGYAYEPWHIRYVGILAAAEIMDKGITLEEYLGQQ
ncbi:MAG: M15 family metallopeptidase [Bacillota bacterium]|nr:M15 family metallopeptidase [Bacillota bacterium]